MSIDIFCQAFESIIPQLRERISDAFGTYQNKSGHRFIWETLEDVIIPIVIQSITELPLSIAIEDIIAAQPKSAYPNINIRFEGKEYAIDIKSGEDSHNPWYDIGRLDTYGERHLKRYAGEYCITVRWKNRTQPEIISTYIEPTYQSVGYSSLYRGVRFRLYDGNIRPKSWSDFETGYTYWKTIDDFRQGLRAAITYKRKLHIKDLQKALTDDLFIIISEGENERLELKSTACWNRNHNSKDTQATEKIIKAVVGFMNSKEGGLLVIGVADDNTIVGLMNDYRVADPKKQNRDGYQLFLRNTLNNVLGADVFPFYKIVFHEIEGEDICQIEVRPSAKPVFYKGELFVRNGNQTIKLSTQEALAYIRYRWRSL